MNTIGFYTFLFLIIVEVLLFVLKDKLQNHQNRLAGTASFSIFPSSGNLFLTPPTSLACGFSFATLFQLKPVCVLYVGTIVITVIITYIISRNELKWVSFFENEIRIYYPLRGKLYIVSSSQIIKVGYYSWGWFSNYFIEFNFENAKIYIPIEVGSEAIKFEKYFISRGIEISS